MKIWVKTASFRSLGASLPKAFLFALPSVEFESFFYGKVLSLSFPDLKGVGRVGEFLGREGEDNCCLVSHASFVFFRCL